MKKYKTKNGWKAFVCQMITDIMYANLHDIIMKPNVDFCI